MDEVAIFLECIEDAKKIYKDNFKNDWEKMVVQIAGFLYLGKTIRHNFIEMRIQEILKSSVIK